LQKITIYTCANQFLAVEIKAGETLGEHFFSSLRKLKQLLPEQVEAEVLVYGGQSAHVRNRVHVTNPLRFAQALQELEEQDVTDGS
jgi:hypothetical protein